MNILSRFLALLIAAAAARAQQERRQVPTTGEYATRNPYGPEGSPIATSGSTS